jgi:hypothetical protein
MIAVILFLENLLHERMEKEEHLPHQYISVDGLACLWPKPP